MITKFLDSNYYEAAGPSFVHLFIALSASVRTIQYSNEFPSSRETNGDRLSVSNYINEPRNRE